MARQNGIVKIEGTVGDITFYKSRDGDLLKRKGGISATRIANDPAFARTRENGAEFGSAASASRILRHDLRSLMLNASDPKVTSRVTQLMLSISKLDTVSVRGKRNAAAGLATAEGKAALKGFDFNLNAPLKSVLFKPAVVAPDTGVITLNGLVPKTDVSAPLGATHMAISGAFAVIDFATGINEVQFTNVLNLPIDGTSSNAVLTPTAVPAGTGIKLYLVKIEFFQVVNTVQYSLNSGTFNALAIVEIA